MQTSPEGFLVLSKRERTPNDGANIYIPASAVSPSSRTAMAATSTSRGTAGTWRTRTRRSCRRSMPRVGEADH